MSVGQSYHSFNKLFISTAHAQYGLFNFRLCYVVPLNRGHNQVLRPLLSQALYLLSPKNVKFSLRKEIPCHATNYEPFRTNLSFELS